MSGDASSAQPSNHDTHLAEQEDRPRPSSSSSWAKSSIESGHSDESTPLLSRNEDTSRRSEAPGTVGASEASTTSLRSAREEPGKRSFIRARWPTVVALSTLTIAMLVIMALGFATPAVVEEYVQQAAVFEPTNLSIDSFTAKGINVRVQGDFFLDALKVQKKSVRDLGRAATWVTAAVEAHPVNVEAVLPDYGNVLLGTAEMPPLTVSVRNREITHLDFVANLESGDLDAVRRIANDWLQGKLKQLKVLGKSKIALKSGIFSLGMQRVSHDLVFNGSNLPSMPRYDVTKLTIHEKNETRSNGGIHADIEIAVFNKFPVSFHVPPLNFDVLVPGCTTQADDILIASATTRGVDVKPDAVSRVAATAIVRQLPDTLISICPDSSSSPLDTLLSSYMHGMETTVLVQGSRSPAEDTPQWLSELMENVILPVPVTGHSFENLIQDFSLRDVHFSMPNPLADPESPEAQPKISATVRVRAKLPQEINFSINVPRVRAYSDVFFKGRRLGTLDLHRWQSANSSQIGAHDRVPPKIVIESTIRDAPLNVTNNEVLREIIEDLFFSGGDDVLLAIEASVDMQVSTILGSFVVRGIPAQGNVPIRPMSNHHFEDLGLQIGQLALSQTTKSSVSLTAMVSFTNPTNYSASLPYADVNLSWNHTLLGHATVKDIDIHPGRNTNVGLQAVWNPQHQSGSTGVECSRELISRYVSGYNTTLTLNTHSGSIPSLPRLGKVLSRYAVEIATPRLSPPKNPNSPGGEPGERQPHFIDDATMHLWSSTATFTLLSPLKDTTLYLTHINATAIYNHTEPVGRILYDLPFAVPPGATTSPRLPVDWSIGGVGYEAVKDALGGTLKLDAEARVGLRIGQWEERVWFEGSGIGAHVRI